MKIAMNKIAPNPRQPRKVFSKDEMEELASSIRQYGLVQPVTVEQYGDGYILVDGERRFRAHQMIGAKEIEVVVREGTLDDQARLELALIANLQRVDLSPVEEGRGYDAMRKGGMKLIEIAHKMGVCQSRVVSRLRLLDLDDEIQDLVEEGLLPVDHRATEALLSVKDAKTRVALARRMAREGVTIGAIVIACQRYNAALAAEGLGGGFPIMALAKKKRTAWRPENESRWDILAQVGERPPWRAVEKAALKACQKCPWYHEANETICRDCPAVDMLVEMMKLSGG